MDWGAEGRSTPCSARNSLGSKGAEGALHLILALYLHPLLCSSVTIHLVPQWTGSKVTPGKIKSGFPSRASFHFVSFPEPGHGIRKVGACGMPQEERHGATLGWLKTVVELHC